MALRDLLVLVGKGTEAANAFAAELARTAGAGLTAAIPVNDPALPPYVMAELPNELLMRVQEEAAAEASRSLTALTEMARGHGVAVEAVRFRAAASRVSTEFGRLARCFDAAVLPQPDPTGLDTWETIEATLLGASRPVVIVPYIKSRAAIGTALVAWDGSAAAARALADSLPFLALARRVQVVAVGDGANLPPHLATDMVVRHLTRHGIPAEGRRVPGGDIDPANMLLSHAADIGADLMVMGGYGHSRIREAMLGGTTREILRSMTVPVVMAH